MDGWMDAVDVAMKLLYKFRLDYATSVVHGSLLNSRPCWSSFQCKLFKVLHVKVGYYS